MIKTGFLISGTKKDIKIKIKTLQNISKEIKSNKIIDIIGALKNE